MIIVCVFFSDVNLFAQKNNIHQEPIKIKAEQIIYHKKKNTYQAQGHVFLDQGKRHIEADEMIVNLNTNQAKLKGNIFLKMDQDWIRAETAEIDLNTYQGILSQAQVFMSENHIYIKGKNIEKTGEQTYLIEDAYLTTCDGEAPAWHFTAKKVKVTLQGWATASNIVFWAKSLPLAYVPYLILPAKKDRQSGFLFPYFGHSNRDGFDFTLPFFWAIKPNMDVTFYQRYLSNRGWMEGLEYRYMLNETDKGLFYFDYLNDDREDIDFTWDEFCRSNKKRWWWRSKQDHILPENIYAQLDIDLVSDQDYIREFTEGFNSYRNCRKEFLHYFNRDFRTDEAALLRESSVSLTKNWSDYSLVAEAQYTQNLDKAQDEYTLQRLPQISFLRNDSRLFHTPLFFKLDATSTYFWRLEGIKGERIHFAPSFSLPYKNKYFKLLPRFSFLETNYFLTDKEKSRFLYETSLEAKTDLWARFSNFIHHLEPRIVYTFRPRVEQSDLPKFDDLDVLPELNQITYSLTNYFFLEQENKLKELMRFYITQSCNFDKKNHPLSDLLIEWQIKPLFGVFLDAETAISPYGEGFTEANIMFGFSTKRADYFNINYQYRPGETEDLATEIFVHLIHNWSFRFYNQHSFRYKQDIEKRVSLHYAAQCWGVEFVYADIYDDTKFMVIFSLNGIGQIKGISLGGG